MARTTESQVKLTANGEQAVSTLGELQSQVKTLSKELRQLTPDTEAFNNKTKELAAAQNRLQDIREEAQRVRQQMRNLGDDAKNARADLLGMSQTGQQIQQLSETFNLVRGAIATNINALGVLRVAIVSTGIGALVVAVGALVTWFTRSEEGGKKLEVILKTIGLVTDRLTRILIDLGEALFNAFENPKQALIDFSNFLVNNIINRFKALGVIVEGIAEMDVKKLADGMIQVSSGIENATDKMQEFGTEINTAVVEGEKLAGLVDEIEGAENKLIVTNAKAEAQISKLLLQAKDRTKSEGERLLILDQVSAIETQRLQEQIALADLKYQQAFLNHQNTLRNKLDEQETEKALAEAEASRILLQKESIDLQEKISIRRNALLDQLTEKRKAQLEAEQKAQEAALKAELELARRITDLQVLNIQDEGERKRSQILLQYKRQIEDAFNQGILTKELEAELLIQRDNALTTLEEDLEAKKKADKEKKAADRAAEKQQELAFEIEAQIVAQENARTSELERDQAIYLIRRNGMEARLSLLAEEGKKESLEYRKQQLEIQKLDNEHAKKQVDIAQKTYDTEEKLQRAKVDMFVGVASDIKNTLAADENNRRRFAGIIKAMTIAEIVGNGIKEVQAIWMNANSNPINAIAPGWAQAFAGVQTAFAAFRTGTAIANVSGLQLFEKGGVLFPHGGILTDGQRHSSGGIKLIDGKNGRFLGEVERGEALHVYSRQTVENNRPVIDALLDTSMFRNGAPITGRAGVYENGGVVPVGTRNGEGGATAEVTAQASAALLEEMRGVRRAVEAFPTRVRAVVTYEQMKVVADEASQIEQEAAA